MNRGIINGTSKAKTGLKTIVAALLLLVPASALLVPFSTAQTPIRKPILFLLTAPWCPACHKTETLLQDMRSRRTLTDVIIKTLDIDKKEDSQLAEAIVGGRITSIPQMILCVPARTIIGSQSESAILAFVRGDQPIKVISPPELSNLGE